MRFKLQIIYFLLEIKWLRIRHAGRWGRLRARRWRRFRRNLCNVPFYQALADAKAPLTAFPILNKARFNEHFDQLNPHEITFDTAYQIAQRAEQSRDFSPTIDGVTVGLSSGTSGNRGIFLASEKERARWVALVLDRVIGFSFRRRKVAFFLRANSNLYQSGQSRLLAFHFFDLLDPIAANLARLEALQPTILIAQPSMLLEIASAIDAQKLHITPEKVISVAEVLTPEDQAWLSRVFGQTIHQVYQCTEGFLAHTCRLGTLHINEDFIHLEKRFLDDEQRFHPILTDLLRTTQPIVRYELNDILLAGPPCACGSTMQAIAQIEGRSDDMLVFTDVKGETVKIFPDFFRRAIVSASPEIRDYALLQRSPQRLELFVASAQAADFDLAVGKIQALLNSHAIHGVAIAKRADKGHTRGTKLRRIKNEQHETD